MSRQRESTIQARTALVHEAEELMRAQLHRDLQLAEVAHAIATSPRQLQRAFREIAASTYRARLTQMRMEQAATLLAQGDLAVLEVARAVGYRQPAQFAKAFRRHHGVLPSQLRTAALAA